LNDPGRKRLRRDGRYFHRDASHRESHAQSELDLPPITEHPLASAAKPVTVAEAAGLAEMIEHLTAAGSFAFDSEFIGERSYEPHLCLLQAATAERVYVVDPLAGADLGGLWELIARDDVEKIVLAGQQDFGPAVQHTGRPPANIMDVQIAAGFIHADYPLSLARLVETFLGVSLGKGMTFTHWDRRPLSAVQMRYAADDVRYLPAARDVIGRRLEEAGRADWARQECRAALEELSVYQPPAETLYQRVRGRDRLGRRELAVLRELAVVRDAAARHEDEPPRTLVKDGVLLAMARRRVHSLEDLDRIKGLPRPFKARYGRELAEAGARALTLPEDHWPPAALREMPEDRERGDRVWVEIVRFCEQRSVAPALVASRKEVVRLCHAAAAGETLDEHRLMRGWRRELLGERLDELLKV